MSVKIKRALISVSDKTGIAKFAKTLEKFEISIISTGGTYASLANEKIRVMKVEEITGFPEMMEGRLKTLHPFVHGAILADRTKKEHLKQADDAGIKLIDMVVVNLYPFSQTVSRPDVTVEEAVENIDIGGPTMIRSAAKNSRSVAVIVDPGDYDVIADEMDKNNGEISSKTLFMLGIKAFQHTCEYDSVIFNYFINRPGVLRQEDSEPEEKEGIRLRPYLKIDCTKAENTYVDSHTNTFVSGEGGFNDFLSLDYEKIQNLRYGENPHQKAAYYRENGAGAGVFASGKKLQGKELSYNNILDANAAFAIVKEFAKPCVAVIKHNNPCGVATAPTVTEAYHNAHFADPVSAFGGVVACNFTWTSDAARLMSDKFVEVLIAPDYEDEALKVLSVRENIRIIKIDFDLQEYLENLKSGQYLNAFDIKGVDGGLLVQECDIAAAGSLDYKVVTENKPDIKQVQDLLFAWQIVKSVKSNAIVLALKNTTVGIGAGQMSRVDSTKIAVEKAGSRAKGSVLASDAFFPFGDAVEIAVNAGVSAIIQPGGSVKDEESIKICNKFGIPMLFTGIRHFKH
ncbi:MAG: bifunctional phosphoribosylaminoimidazolecarboxamide formyltransferase/IMP cyclohydrolase [Actinobacteria bacterium]|nr:bifunctional phosphoribosylaminoimidazolecarboxamide formyltransferase/IMP cyclohydrolase [Actinomycetota bacterium]